MTKQRSSSPISSAPVPYPAVDAIRQRRSVRTYEPRPLDSATIHRLQAFIDSLSNPFGARVTVTLVDRSLNPQGEKLGTYGVIKGASTYLCLSVQPGPQALLGAGYAFEDLILYATSLGLGTVWLGVTFQRSRFLRAMQVPQGCLLPAISPVGYAAPRQRIAERVMRATIRADRRRPWSQLFFDGDFNTPLTPAAAGHYAQPLEMLRLAPSATNAQPWRILKSGSSLHFYLADKSLPTSTSASTEVSSKTATLTGDEAASPASSSSEYAINDAVSASDPSEDAILYSQSLKQLDMGIAALHFVRTLQSTTHPSTTTTPVDSGIFTRLPATQRPQAPAPLHYVTTFHPLP